MINWFQPTFWGNEEAYVLDALKSTWISDGAYIDLFEKHFSEIHEVPHAITVNNGTSALHLALLALEIGCEDEVIIPGFTFAAPANMTLLVGATPVYVDIDPDTWCIDISKIEEAITPRTKAIIPVHVYGNVCNMPAIMEVAEKYGLAVIEDTAEAVFSKCQNRMAGTFGHYGTYSFQVTKTITMGEGGALVTSNNALNEKARLIRNHGMQGKKRYWHYAIGHNFRLTNYQAALGYAQLESLPAIIENKMRVWRAYTKNLQGINGIVFQCIPADVEPVMWSVAIKIDANYFNGTAETLREKLAEKGIETRGGFFPFSEMPIYNAPYLTVSKALSDSIISLPSYTLITEEDINCVCQRLLDLRK